MANKRTHMSLITLLILLVSACTTRPLPVYDTVKSSGVTKAEFFIARDGAELFLRHEVPKGRKPKAQLILLHGFNEHSGAFTPELQAFAQSGVEVWAIDQRGFGRSPGRGLWFGHEMMSSDVVDLLRYVKTQRPNQAIYLLGVSMGGAVSIVTATDKNLPLDGVILSAPAVWSRKTQPFYQRWALAIAAKVAPEWTPTGESLQIQATDNIPMLRRIWASPWMIRHTRIATIVGLNDLMDAAYQGVSEIKYPVKLVYGAKDQLIPTGPIEAIRARLPSHPKSTYQHYPNGWHMLLRDKQGGRVIKDVVSWISSGAS